MKPAPEEAYDKLFHIWERSVGATHAFLDPADFEILKTEVPGALRAVERLFIYEDPKGEPCGFVAVEDGKVEMLFVDPPYIGKGVGSALFDYAVRVLGARSVDVNEQNRAGLDFYLRKGFIPVGRSEKDPYGRPYPILTLAGVPQAVNDR